MVDVYWRECVRCGVAIAVTEAQRDVAVWLCPTCGGTKYAEPKYVQLPAEDDTG